jgi:hypothetical protein
MAVLTASDRTRPMWLVQVWGYHVQSGDLLAPVIPDEGTLYERPTFPAQVIVGFSTGNVRHEEIYDASGGVMLNLPPSPQVTIDVMLPVESARIIFGPPRSYEENQLPATAGAFITGKLMVTAWALGGRSPPADCPRDENGRPLPHLGATLHAPIERSRNRSTRVSNLAINTQESMRIPAGAQRLTIYDGPQQTGVPSPVLTYRWVAVDDGAPANVMPLGDILPRVPNVVPAFANAVQVFNGPAVARVAMVWEVD